MHRFPQACLRLDSKYFLIDAFTMLVQKIGSIFSNALEKLPNYLNNDIHGSYIFVKSIFFPFIVKQSSKDDLIRVFDEVK